MFWVVGMIRKIHKIFSARKEDKVKKDLFSLKANILDSFDHIKKDMKEQKKWIDYLHNGHRELNGIHAILDEKQNKHQEIHSKDIDNINNWINHLHETSKDQEKYMKDLERNISLAFEKYNKYLLDLYKLMADNASKSKENLVDHGRPQTRLDAQITSNNQESYNGDMVSQDSTKTDDNKKLEVNITSSDTKSLSYYSNILTRSEKKILGELCNTNMKLSYKDLAIVLGVSPNTAKNHICHIKNKGFPIKESDDSKGIKRYYVPDNMKKVLLSKTV